MKNALFASVMLLALVAVASAQNPAAATAEKQSQKNELVQLTNEWIDAINAKDRPGLDRLMAPDFVLRGWDGSWQVERARWLDNLFHVIDIQAYSHSAISAQVFGDVAAVTSNWYWHGVRGTDVKKPFEEHGYVVDVWRRDAGHWRVVSRTSVVLPGKEESPKQ
jgi:ketosteroid isomerase-like protein